MNLPRRDSLDYYTSISIYHSIYIFHYISFSTYLSLHIFLFIYFSPYLSLHIFPSISFSTYIYLYFSLHIYFHICFYVFFSSCLSLYIFRSFTHMSLTDRFDCWLYILYTFTCFRFPFYFQWVISRWRLIRLFVEPIKRKLSSGPKTYFVFTSICHTPKKPNADRIGSDYIYCENFDTLTKCTVTKANRLALHTLNKHNKSFLLSHCR